VNGELIRRAQITRLQGTADEDIFEDFNDAGVLHFRRDGSGTIGASACGSGG
jgi:hypothetical protein